MRENNSQVFTFSGLCQNIEVCAQQMIMIFLKFLDVDNKSKNEIHKPKLIFKMDFIIQSNSEMSEIVCAGHLGPRNLKTN